MITIIDYKAGNLTSVQLAFQALGVEAKITDDPAVVLAAERVVFPGVGAAGASMDSLHRLGLAEAIKTQISRGIPFLGICVGMQVLFEFSEEDQGVPCLGVVPGRVKRFSPSNARYKIPHMGWNRVRFKAPHPLLTGIEDESEFYFVHSYYPAPTQADHVFGQTDYAEVNFASIVGRDNLLATQFHPEKSGRIGLKLLENFTRWDGKC
jgi:glutamine amidotransferase